jgi:nucleoside-triphosphatase
MRQVILLTGEPGSGKTTMIQRVLARLSVPAGGFYTQEVREKGTRTGFELVTLDGRRAVLAHVNLQSRKRVGKYGVNLAVLDTLAVASIQEAASERKIIVIDEIGPMEILSERFRDAVMQVLQNGSTVLGTIVERSTPFTDQIKALLGVVVIQVRPDNRDALLEQIVMQMTNR